MSTSNTEFAKTLGMPAEWAAKAAAFADAKGLSLAAREVVASYKEPWRGNDGKVRDATLMLVVTAEAMMAMALRERTFAPISTEYTEDGSTWVDVWLTAMPPAACRVTFEVQGIDAPVRVVHTWLEYTQGKATPTQMKMPATMLGKATRSLGVRQIAPSATSGLVSEEESHAVEAVVDADREQAAAVQDAVTPPSEVEASGSKLTKAEQFAARKAELVATGRALRSEVGDAAAEKLSTIINNMRANGSTNLDELKAAELKSILASAKEIRKEFANKPTAPTPAAEPEPTPEPAGAQPPEDATLAALSTDLDAEFVI